MPLLLTSSCCIGPDRTQLVVDLGHHYRCILLLVTHRGLFNHLIPPAHHLDDARCDAINYRLLKRFAKDVVKDE